MKTQIKMDKDTLSALKESIEHWKRLAGVTPRRLGEVIGVRDCALCALFNRMFYTKLPVTEAGDNSKCSGCPVREATGQDFCHGTPYGEVVAIYESDELGTVVETLNSPEFKAAAVKELAFLESLLPTPTKEHHEAT